VVEVEESVSYENHELEQIEELQPMMTPAGKCSYGVGSANTTYTTLKDSSGVIYGYTSTSIFKDGSSTFCTYNANMIPITFTVTCSWGVGNCNGGSCH